MKSDMQKMIIALRKKSEETTEILKECEKNDQIVDGKTALWTVYNLGGSIEYEDLTKYMKFVCGGN